MKPSRTLRHSTIIDELRGFTGPWSTRSRVRARLGLFGFVRVGAWLPVRAVPVRPVRFRGSVLVRGHPATRQTALAATGNTGIHNRRNHNNTAPGQQQRHVLTASATTSDTAKHIYTPPPPQHLNQHWQPNSTRTHSRTHRAHLVGT